MEQEIKVGQIWQNTIDLTFIVKIKKISNNIEFSELARLDTHYGMLSKHIFLNYYELVQPKSHADSLQPQACPHQTVKTYDSGWTKYEYCVQCNQRLT